MVLAVQDQVTLVTMRSALILTVVVGEGVFVAGFLERLVMAVAVVVVVVMMAVSPLVLALLMRRAMQAEPVVTPLQDLPSNQ